MGPIVKPWSEENPLEFGASIEVGDLLLAHDITTKPEWQVSWSDAIAIWMVPFHVVKTIIQNLFGNGKHTTYLIVMTRGMVYGIVLATAFCALLLSHETQLKEVGEERGPSVVSLRASITDNGGFLK